MMEASRNYFHKEVENSLIRSNVSREKKLDGLLSLFISILLRVSLFMSMKDLDKMDKKYQS